jgi:predicted transcriptional regulator YdeE
VLQNSASGQVFGSSVLNSNVSPQIAALIATNYPKTTNFDRAMQYLVAVMAGHEPKKLPDGLTKAEIDNAYFYAFIVPQLNQTSKLVPEQKPSAFYGEIVDQSNQPVAGAKIVEFYGKVIDGNNQPVEGANVEFVWVHLFPPPKDTPGTNVITDRQGLFSLSGVIGSGLSVHVSKDGYYNIKSLNRDTFNYYTLSNSPAFQPDSNNPVIFHIQKNGQEQPIRGDSP